MDTPSTQRRHIIEAIDTLPDDVITELSSFIDYLRYKSTSQLKKNSRSANFLLSISALGTSSESDISERDEEILINEFNSNAGWSLNSNERV